MQESLTLFIPLTVLIGFLFILFRYNLSAQTYLLFVIYLMPFMAFKVVKEDWGGFKIIDIVSYISMILLLTKFSSAPLSKTIKSNLAEIALLLVIIILGLLKSDASHTTLFKILKIFPVFIFTRFFIIESTLDRMFRHKAIKALKMSFIFSLCFLLLQIAFGLAFTWYPSLNPNISDPANDFIRYPGIFYDPQLHGQFLAIGSFLILVPLGENRKISLNDLGLFFMTAGAIALTGSRSALGGFVLGLLAIFLMAGKRYFVHMLSLIFIFAILYTTLFMDSPVFSRGATVGNDLEFRQSIWKEAFATAKDNPLLGIGWGNYQTYIERHNQDQYLILNDEILYFDQPESGYLKIGVEIGIFGFILFIAIILKALIWGLKAFLKRTQDITPLLLVAALISWMFAFTTVYSFFDERILFMIALVIALLHNPTEILPTDQNEIAHS